MSPIAFKHLTILDEKFNFYFSSLKTNKCDWVRNPFIQSLSDKGLQLFEDEELTSISSNCGLKIEHVEVAIITIWMLSKKNTLHYLKRL